MSAVLKYVNGVKNSPNNGLMPPASYKDGKWNVTCYCGSPMMPVFLPFPEYNRDCDIPNCSSCATDRFSGKTGAFYSCARDGCDGLHSAHKTVTAVGKTIVGKPMGRVAYPECQKLRHYAHIEFDHLWEYLGKSRAWGYRLLARMVKSPLAQAHMSEFGIHQCKLAIFNVRKYKIQRNIPLILPF